MPRATNSRSIAPNTLRAMLKRLDALRTKIADQTKDAEQLAKQALAAFKRDSIGTEIFIGPNRKAIVVTPDDITVDAAKFRDLAMTAGKNFDEIESCFDLARERATALLGADPFASITTRKPGKPQLRFTGKR